MSEPIKKATLSDPTHQIPFKTKSPGSHPLRDMIYHRHQQLKMFELPRLATMRSMLLHKSRKTPARQQLGDILAKRTARSRFDMGLFRRSATNLF